MQKKMVLARLFFPMLFALLIASPGYCQTADETFKQFKLELKNEGISDEFIKTTENSIKRMITCAASTVEIKKVLLDLWTEKVKGRALKNAVAAVAELVESGDNVLEAGSIASGAAHKAEAVGLGGFGVGMRVKKAVQDRKTYLKSLKNNIVN
jgi:hypothetical protein